MEEQNHEQTQQIKPGQARRKWLRWLAVPAGVAVLALVYQLTRPPELVWWRSPLSPSSRARVSVLVPSGWQLAGPYRFSELDWYEFQPVDGMPSFLGRWIPNLDWQGELIVRVQNEAFNRSFDLKTNMPLTSREVLKPQKSIWARVTYARGNRLAFNRTYKQICNSLTIE